ncbi:uncharacterized protein LOC104443942 [Eucalyptus grandis]|uniref:uncharacterized protein LOC104443942 n=1 Tax=Eucalyptus grandis TaxID=71139 RepID=UPI00192EB39F|nr:uncharacterized protein LOC104443942 [Eucalyptus grandis]XP_018729890.2 uncharacterized protein LOC104443942 [Eucalyptus grandis]
MDAGFQNLGFSVQYSSNPFSLLGGSMQVGGSKGDYDTILRLNSPGSSFHLSPIPQGVKRKRNSIDGTMELQQVGSPLFLGLGWCSSSSDSKGSSATACTAISSAKETEGESSMVLDLDFTLHLGCDKMPCPKKVTTSDAETFQMQPKVDLELSLSTGPSESGVTNVHPDSPPFKLGKGVSLAGCLSSAEVESTPRFWKASVPLPPLNQEAGFFLNQDARNAASSSMVPNLSSTVITTPNSPVTCTSGITKRLPQQRSSTKICQVEGCGKGARGASGRCISHGGGRRCQRPGCPKGAEGRTVFCKAHGGGRRCESLGCTKSAEGRTDYCIAHGGGRRCSHAGGCTRAARGKSGLCIKHGGGKRCQKEGCTKSAEGLSGLCISHGGGRRCQSIGCSKGAQGSTLFCKAHGGGKRCTYAGCTKGAEGSTPFCKGHGGGKRCSHQGGGVCTKSVHGGTAFCVAHGGGKRCAVPGCTKSARGRTDSCVRHGGGKRCQAAGCSKSAQGSTDFCKAHGGGKRCAWGHPRSGFGGEGSSPCTAFARGKTGLCALHSGLVQDRRVHGAMVVGTMVQSPTVTQLEKAKETVTTESMSIDVTRITGSEVTSSGTAYSGLQPYGLGNAHYPVTDGGLSSMSVSVPEGRVHGGSLMALLASGSPLGPANAEGSVIDQSKSVKSMVHWSQM